MVSNDSVSVLHSQKMSETFQKSNSLFSLALSESLVRHGKQRLTKLYFLFCVSNPSRML